MKNKIWRIRYFEWIWFDKQEDISRVFAIDFSKRFKYEKSRLNFDFFDYFHSCILEEENRN